MRVLIADDSPTILRVLQMSLQIPGITEVISASTGPEALSVLQSTSPPTMAILDWQMPGLSGLDICRQIRVSKCLHRPYIILISSSSSEEEIIEAGEGGADDFITKPISRGLLQSRVIAGMRILSQQDMLIDRYRQIEQQMAVAQDEWEFKVRTLKGEAGESGQMVARPFPTFLTPDEIRAMVDRALGQTGYGSFTSTASPEKIKELQPEVACVHFMILPDKSLWIDLLLETTFGSAQALFQSYTGMEGEPPSNEEAADVVRETLNMFQSNLKSTLRTKGVDPMIPLVPQLMPANLVDVKISPRGAYSRSLHQLKDVTLRFTLYVYACPVKNKALSQIAPADVLAQDLHPADGSEMVLINKGSFMDSRCLAKVENLAQASLPTATAPIFEPTPLIKLLADA